MKLILYSIKLETDNKFFLLFHIAALVIVSYVILQYYGGRRGVLQDAAYTGEYTVNVSLSESVSAEKIEECAATNGFVYAMLYSETPCFYDEDDPTPYLCVSFLGTPSDDPHFRGGELKENTVYIPYSMTLLYGIDAGDTIDINDHSYEIAGTSGLDHMLVFPIDTLVSDHTVRNMSIYLNAEILTDEQYSESLEKLQQILGDDAWVDADEFDETFQDNLSARRNEATFFFLLGTVCIVFVYAFILSKRKRRFSICSICGASKKNIVTMIGIGTFAVFTFSFVVAALLGKAVNLLIFEPFFGYDTYVLEFSDFLLFYVIMLVIYIAVITIFAGKFIKNTAIGNYRRSE